MIIACIVGSGDGGRPRIHNKTSAAPADQIRVVVLVVVGVFDLALLGVVVAGDAAGLAAHDGVRGRWWLTFLCPLRRDLVI